MVRSVYLSGNLALASLRSGDVGTNAANETEGANGAGVNWTKDVNEKPGNRFGTLLWLGLIAAAVIFLIRRVRRRKS